MSPFEFLMVLVAIIIGLAIAEFLYGVLGILKRKTSARLYWVHLSWAAWVLINLVQHWWSGWRYEDVELGAWTIWHVLLVLLPSFLLFLAAGLMFPADRDEQDLRQHFFDIRVNLLCRMDRSEPRGQRGNDLARGVRRDQQGHCAENPRRGSVSGPGCE